MRNATDLSDVRIRIPLGMLNRHGLVAGATGTGKTKTLQLLAEQLSAQRRPGLRRRHQGRPVRAQRARGGERQDHRPRRVGRPGVDGDRLPGRVLRARRPGHRHPAAGDDDARSGRCCSARCSASTTPRSRASAWSSTTPTRPGLPLLDLADLRAVVHVPHQRRGQGRPQGPRRPVQRHRRRDPARADRVRGPGRRRVLRRAGVRVRATSCRSPPTARA